MMIKNPDDRDSSPAPQADNTTGETQPLAPLDFYYEGPYLVFTAAYHLKRGYCCNSGCRHCPYR
ncbi:DUF5522 domain-containing protein [Edaphobacter aggregans]|uniref:DUF5522 domain-containing protein n=1 Tax=Edaphobacter aggregans TaxID=570835 RepID=UPI000B306A3D|nr:DUF5522 domain-containing protein [Edaphobacter aggregans]